MKKSTKGAVAAAAAGVLLLGGAGSLAFWSDSVTVGGDTISSGHLSLDDTTGGVGGSCATADWKLDGGTVFDTATGLLVPGDTLTKNCTFDISALGEHLSADLAVTGGTSAGALASEVSTDASFTVGGATVTSIDESNHAEEVSATITLTFDGPAATNVSQDESLVLSAYTVTATQAHS